MPLPLCLGACLPGLGQAGKKRNTHIPSSRPLYFLRLNASSFATSAVKVRGPNVPAPTTNHLNVQFFSIFKCYLSTNQNGDEVPIIGHLRSLMRR